MVGARPDTAVHPRAEEKPMTTTVQPTHLPEAHEALGSLASLVAAG